VLCALGCVERKMVIRSEPAGAPVWVDERYAGVTPVEQKFSFYGARSIRVGPIRDQNDKVQYCEQQRVVEITAPPYESFPVDFYYEVLYPKTLTDVHELPVFKLSPPEQVPQGPAEERVKDVREKAKELRDKALRTVPEEAPAP
jgi:hypothetical protein